MPITYAGVPLTPPNTAFEVLKEWWHGNRISEWEFQDHLVPGVQHLPVPYLPQRDPPRIGVLSWPTGADRFAVCHLIATGDQIDAVRAAVGTAPAAQPLVFTDAPLGTGTVTADMHAIIRPISQRANGKELYLLSLVDDRFFWLNSGGGQVEILSTWEQLFTDLFALIGVTATIDPIPAAYLVPNAKRWVTGIQPVPMLIESAARQVGMRVVRRLDGSVSVQSYSTAQSEDSARWAAVSELAMAGGRLTGSDVGIISPASVDVCFFDDTKQNVTLTSLSLTDYGGVSGVASKVARWTADPDGPTSPEKTAYATQAATDYYDWNLALTDATLRSFVGVDPCGLDEVVEWVHHPTKFVTRIVRPQWSDRNVYGSEAPAPSATGDAPEYKDDCLNGYLIRYKATITLDPSGLRQTSYAFDKSYGIPCAPEVSGSGAGSGPGFGGSGLVPDAQFPDITEFDFVSGVCPSPCAPAVGDVTIKPSGAGNATCFLKADGHAVSRARYPDLFAAYGTTFGTGDGSTTFNLPTLPDPVTGLSYFVTANPPSDLTLERTAATILSGGALSPPSCSTARADDCCAGSGPTDCCGGEAPSGTTAVAFDGPLAADCGQGTVAGTLQREGTVGLSYALPSPVGGELGGAFTARLFCAGTEWWLAGVLNVYGFPQPVFYAVRMTLDEPSGLLLGVITVPGCGDVAVAAVPPCGSSGGSGGGQGSCPDGHGYLNLAFSDKTGDCTCLPDSLTGTAGAFPVLTVYPTTTTCEGNCSYSLSCLHGQFVLQSAAGQVGTLVSYAPGRIVFRISLPPASCCGPGGGAVTVTLT